MIPGLKEIDSVCGHGVHQPVLLRNSAGPSAGKLVFQRLGLSDPLKRVGEDSLDELQDP